MKVLILFFLLIIFFANKAKAQSPVLLHDKAALKESHNFLRKSIFIESDEHGKTNFIYQRLEWEIDPAIRYISGKISTTFKSQSPNLSTIDFDISNTLTVDSILQNNAKLDYTRADDKIKISLHSILNENEIDSLTIYYQGIPPDSGFGSFTLSTHGSAKTPVLWTLSEPYGAKEWWPCKQSLSDKIDSIDVIVTSPANYRTASNGVLISEATHEGKRTMHWKHRFPIATYLVAIAVTNYENHSDYAELDNGKEIEILNYVYPEDLEKARTQTPVTADLIKLFDTLVGEYPFASEKYGHAQFGWQGGMEHQTMSFMGYFNFDLIAHELAHQWFGDYITLGSWQDIWLNEGFATYLNGLAYEHHADTYHWPAWKKGYKNRILSKPDGSVFVTDTTSIERLFDFRLSYAKGAFILHMQRWILGDNVFFSALRNYFNDEKVANGFAYSKDWIKHVETAGDTILTDFFDSWLYGEGYPIYSITYQQNGTDSLALQLSQTTSHNSVNFFRLPVPVRIYNPNKTDSIDFRLEHRANNQKFMLYTGFIVDEIVIDPDHWILCKTDAITRVPIISTSEEIVVYPNPATAKISILPPNNQAIANTLLYSMEGKLLYKFESGNEIDVSNFPVGTYFIQVEAGNSTFIKKIIKQ